MITTQNSSRGGLAYVQSGPRIQITLDMSEVLALIKRLDNFPQRLRDRAVNNSFRSATRQATTVARNTTVKVGGFDLTRPEKMTGAVKGMIRLRQMGELAAQIRATSKDFSMSRWAADRDPKADYRGRGVRIAGLYRKNFVIFERDRAFVRKGDGADGIAVFGRVGPARKPIQVIQGANPARVLGSPEVVSPTQSKFFSAFESRFQLEAAKALRDL